MMVMRRVGLSPWRVSDLVNPEMSCPEHPRALRDEWIALGSWYQFEGGIQNA